MKPPAAADPGKIPVTAEIWPGGGKRRVAIARGILNNPPILNLNEATSALDSDLKHVIRQELDRLARNRTTLIIAHHLTYRKSDTS